MIGSDDPLYDTEEAAEYCRRGQSTLEKLRLTGEGPVFIKAGRAVRYRKSDLDAWLNSHRRRSTSEYAAMAA
jgi:predicted DNA-binding transcriptional regulator AlpA